jgi:hypothetical protein
MKVLIVPSALCVLIGGAAATWYQRQHAPAERGKDAVRATLKDPDSALFRDVEFYRFTGATCGQFNAKNSMGGYVGYRKFVVTQTGKLSVQGEIDFSSDEVASECTDSYASR